MKDIRLKPILSYLCSLAIAAMIHIPALAADTIELNQDLFSDMKNLVPGQTIYSQVTLSNKSSRIVMIYLKANPDPSAADTVTILNQIEMKLELDGSILYEGSADGAVPKTGYEAMTSESHGLNLGSFPSGAQKNLLITLSLPGPEFDNQYTDQFAAVDWVFRIEGASGGGNSGGSGGVGSSSENGPISITDAEGPLSPWTGEDEGTNVVITDSDVPLGKVPRTGDSGIGGYVFSMLLALLIACIVLYIGRKKKL